MQAGSSAKKKSRKLIRYTPYRLICSHLIQLLNGFGSWNRIKALQFYFYIAIQAYIFTRSCSSLRKRLNARIKWVRGLQCDKHRSRGGVLHQYRCRLFRSTIASAKAKSPPRQVRKQHYNVDGKSAKRERKTEKVHACYRVGSLSRWVPLRMDLIFIYTGGPSLLPRTRISKKNFKWGLPYGIVAVAKQLEWSGGLQTPGTVLQRLLRRLSSSLVRGEINRYKQNRKLEMDLPCDEVSGRPGCRAIWSQRDDSIEQDYSPHEMRDGSSAPGALLTDFDVGSLGAFANK